MPPTNSMAGVGITQAEFNKFYWFSSLQMVTVVNPLPDAFQFRSEMRLYGVPAGGTESYVGTIANVYLDQMSKTIAQNKEQLELLADPTIRASYYKDLIIEVKDLNPQYDPTNNWQHRMQQAGAEVPPWVKAEQSQQSPLTNTVAPTPPWEQPPMPVPNMERASEAAPTPPPTAPVAPASPTPAPTPPAPAKEETKEFEHEGMKFKMVVDKNGDTMYFRDGRRIDGASYSKAASMV